MNRALVIAALLVVIGGFYVFLIRGKQSISPAEVSHASTTAVQLTTAKEQEETDTYILDAKYPQFGISAIDPKIKMVVDSAITDFKRDASEPLVTSAKYEFTSLFDSVYAGEDVVSIELVISTYLGGAHGIASVNGLNFERKTGRELTLDDALAMTGLTLQEVSKKAKQELQDKLGSDIIAPEGADPTSENYRTFLVSADKVTFVFQVYQVAPYAAGPQEVSFARVAGTLQNQKQTTDCQAACQRSCGANASCLTECYANCRAR